MLPGRWADVWYASQISHLSVFIQNVLKPEFYPKFPCWNINAFFSIYKSLYIAIVFENPMIIK